MFQLSNRIQKTGAKSTPCGWYLIPSHAQEAVLTNEQPQQCHQQANPLTDCTLCFQGNPLLNLKQVLSPPSRASYP